MTASTSIAFGRDCSRSPGGDCPCVGTATSGCMLSALAPGARCTICRLLGGGPIRQRLLDLGLQPGRAVKVVRNAPLRDPIEVQLDSSFIVLRRREAAQIEVTHG